MSITIADSELLRERGALSDMVEQGAPSAQQLDAALMLARSKMIDAVGLVSYVEVKGFTEEDLTDADGDSESVLATKENNRNKRAAFENAECYFAMASLPRVLSLQQLTQSGYIDKTKVGDSESSHASVDAGQRVRQEWEADAHRELASFLAATQESKAEEPKQFGVGKKGSNFFFMDI